jgi:NitT/TauT family transport system ATP-binding protein
MSHVSLEDALSILLRMSDIHFGFRDEQQLLEGFDLNVDCGEFVSLLGPSGCGKSTLLNLAAGLLQPLAGSINTNGRRLTSINREVGYMTQGDTLLPWMTVAKNILLPLDFRQIARDERDRKLEYALKLVNLSDARNKFPSELSGGMKRRALLARSLIYDPSMLLMDEPFSALDAQLRELMHQELLDMMYGTSKGVLFVTHDISEALLLSDRVLVLGGLPLQVVEEVAVPYPKPRDLTAIRKSADYRRFELRLRELLRPTNPN